MISGEIEGWARARNMRFYALWPSMRGLFRGGEMFDGGDRELVPAFAHLRARKTKDLHRDTKLKGAQAIIGQHNDPMA